MMKQFIILFVSYLFLNVPAFGQSVDVGLELNFTKEGLYSADRGSNYLALASVNNEILRKWIPKICPACRIVDGRVTYPDGWWFEVTKDLGVVEIKTLKTTADKYRAKYMKHLADIFLIMKKADLKPDPQAGLSHLHIDLETAFRSDVIAFRNYLVYLTNNQGFLDLLGRNDRNAKFLSQMDVRTIDKFKKILAELDEKIISGGNLPSILEFIKNLPQEMIEKHVAINLKHPIWDLFTVEIRPLNSPKNPEQVLAIAEVFTGSVEYVRGLDGLIPLQDPKTPEEYTEQEKINSFDEVVRSQGKDFHLYKRLLLKPDFWGLEPSKIKNELDLVKFKSKLTCPSLF